MLYSITTIRKKVKEYGDKIKAPRDLLVVPTVSDGMGTPHIEIDENGYNYVVCERGHEYIRNITEDLDTLLFWLLSDIVNNISSDYELNHRKEGYDSRRLWFEKSLELMEKLDPKWKMRTMKHLEEVIQKYPYSDIVSDKNTVEFWGMDIPVPHGYIGCRVKRIDVGSELEIFYQNKLIHKFPKPSSLIPPPNPGVFRTITKTGNIQYQKKKYKIVWKGHPDYLKFVGKRVNVKEEIFYINVKEEMPVFIAIYLDSVCIRQFPKKY